MTLLDRSQFSKAVLCFSLSFFSLVVVPPIVAEENSVDIVADETINGDVVLTPGYISGTVDIGGQNISRIDLTAKSIDYSAKIYPTSEGPYTLTVNVPQGTSLDYTVSGTIWMDSWKTRMFFRDKVVTVYEGQSSQLNYLVDSGYVAGEIVTNGCTLENSEIWATRDDSGGYSKATTKLITNNKFRLPVQPNNDIRVYGQVQLSTGSTYNLEEQLVNIEPGQEAMLNWELNCTAGQLSAIQHDVDYHMPVDYSYTYLYNQGTNSPYRIGKHDGSIRFDNLAPDTWRLYTSTYWNNNQNLITKNITNVTTQSGETTYVPFDHYPGFLQGTLSLTGTHTMEDTSYAHIYGYGQNSLYPSDQVFSRALAGNIDGSFNLALPHGEYRTYVTAFAFFDPTVGEDYLNTYFYVYDYSKMQEVLFINPEEVVGDYNIDYETGAAVIKLRRADGGQFSSPYLIARSYNYNQDNRLESSVYLNSRGLSTSDRVTMIGTPGTYQVEAWAYVDGSLTTFGKVEVEIVPGVEKEIDLGGPVLQVTTPVAGAVISQQLLTVTGTATDETGVETIMVNGNEVIFVSTNNIEDPNEVSFSAEIVAVEGENTIITIATDESGNEAQDSRTVVYEVQQTEISGAILDIKPGSCKNPFNVVSKGVLPVVLLGTADFKVSDIDPESLELQGVAPIRYVIDDAASYVTDGSCETDNGDGYDDLVLKFDTQQLVDVIGPISDGELVTLNLTGTSYLGDSLIAEDTITIIKRGKKNK